MDYLSKLARRISACLCLPLLLATAVACRDGAGPDAAELLDGVPVDQSTSETRSTDVASVTVSPEERHLDAGEVFVRFTATVRDRQGRTLWKRAINWTSSDTAVVYVDRWGSVIGRRDGTALVVAAVDGVADTARVTVGDAPDPEPDPTLVVTPAADTILIGDSARLDAVLLDAAGTPVGDPTFVWSSSDDEIASVHASGRILGLAAGTVTIAATANGFTGTATITVRPVPVASVIVTPPSASVNVGNTVRLSAVALDGAGAPMPQVSITWSSANGAIASVNADGVVAGMAAGTTTIMAAAGAVTAGATITVAAPPPPPSGSLLFLSTWPERGMSPSAIRSGGAWTMSGGSGLEVISAAGLDMPTPNVLRVTAERQSTGFAMLRKEGLTVPAVGESRYYQVYLRITAPDGLEDGETHPFQDGNAGSQSNWTFNILTNAGPNQWRPQFRTSASVNPWSHARWSGPALQKGRTYRFAWQIERTGVATFRMRVRVYGGAQLIADDADFASEANPQATLAGNPTFTFLNVNAMSGLNAGNNGVGGSNPPFPFVYSYQGAIAVSGTGWIPPHQQ